MNNPLNIVKKTDSCGSKANQETKDQRLRIEWQGAQCFIEGKLFYPKIAPVNIQTRDGFNTVIITLNGETKSELKWEKELEAADRWIKEGCKLIWNIDLGLFDRLPFSLMNKSQLMTLSIAVEHFLDEVWPQYQDHTIGICLYRGSLDFSKDIPWNEEVLKDFRDWLVEAYETVDCFNEEEGLSIGSFGEANEKLLARTNSLHLYAADLCVNYLDALAGRVPEELACFVFIDATPVQSALMQARMLTAERAEHLRFVVKNGALPVQDISWDALFSPYGFYCSGEDKPKVIEKPSLGICLPEVSNVSRAYYEGLDRAMELLTSRCIPFRVIPEALLTTEWDGLDELIVTFKGVSVWGLRKLQGFCAAGGKIITIGDALNLPQESSFSEWLAQRNIRV